MKNKLQQHSGKLTFLHEGFHYNQMMVVGDLLLHILSAHLIYFCTLSLDFVNDVLLHCNLISFSYVQ